MKKSSLFLGYVLLFSAGICLGEQNPKTDKLEKAMVMEPVVISATKILTSLEKAGGSSVSVIESKDIESSQQTQLAELLKEVPGLDIVSNGGVGTQSSVFIRGSDAKNTLVLIDGIPVNDPSSPNRSANLGELTLDNVERVEVIR
ncbi:TonB-dependent receptor plug domain-containing protein, partial [bacterium]|nr:TonB-dependent receptor plug domain-containing protein [bacterium]